jgi:hypothetical protein
MLNTRGIMLLTGRLVEAFPCGRVAEHGLVTGY